MKHYGQADGYVMAKASTKGSGAFCRRYGLQLPTRCDIAKCGGRLPARCTGWVHTMQCDYDLYCEAQGIAHCFTQAGYAGCTEPNTMEPLLPGGIASVLERRNQSPAMRPNNLAP